MKSMAKSRKFHWGLFLSPPIDSIAYRERHSCCLFVCLFALSNNWKALLVFPFRLFGPLWAFATVNRLKIFYSIRSVIWSGSYSTPPKKQSNNNHNNAKEILTGGLSHHLFACHAQQLQNVYNRRSVIFLWGVFSFFFNSCLSFSAHLLCCVCRGWYATWALLTSDVVTDHKKVPVDEEPPVKPKQQQQQQQQLLSLSQMLERGRRLHSLRLWVASFRKPPPIFRCCH